MIDWIPPKTLRAWRGERVRVRRRLWQLLGDLPPRPHQPKVIVDSRRKCGGYWKEKFRIIDGSSTIPGYLLLPAKLTQPAPAILYCHWHGGQYEIGKEEIFRAHATPDACGPEFARRGYVVMAIDARGFGERQGTGPGGPKEKGVAEEMSRAKLHLWLGQSLWGMILRDDLIALDYMVSRPEVDPKRIGVTGISMGSTRSWWLAALDERVAAGACVGCMTRYSDLIRERSLDAHGIYYYVPGMLKYFDTEAVISLCAPRPMLFMTGDNDRGSPLAGVRTISRKARATYALYREQAHFRNLIFPKTGHVYRPEMWIQTLRWFNEHLRQAPL